MKTVRLELDYCEGPVWRDYFNASDGTSVTEVDIIDNDAIITELNEKLQNTYSSFYAFDTENAACEFDEDALRAAAPAMLADMQKLVKRLNAINDGSFVIDDYVTPWLMELAEQQ